MRVISLVPSATETLVALGVTPIACTRFCDLPGVPTIGGTKNPDIDAIVAFHPDLVVVNDEENRLEDADALRAAGCRLHSMSPRAVADVEPAINALAEALGVGAPPFEHWSTPSTRHTVFVATWRRPLMTLNANTYASSLLASIGYNNVFADASTRYPEVTLDVAAARAPDIVLLPDEPYPFRSKHIAEYKTVGARVLLVDGRDLFWWGIRTPAAAHRLSTVLAPRAN